MITLSDDDLLQLNRHLEGIRSILAPAAAPAPVAPNPHTRDKLIPAQYAWLAEMGDNVPLTISEAMKEYGVHELSGGANSPRILEWAKEVGLQASYTADSIPWCGLFAAVIVHRAKKTVPKEPLWALHWADFGVSTAQPGLGDVLVFKRDGGGHVTFYVGEDATHFHCLGGNQSDMVCFTRIEKARLFAARRPSYNNQPASVRSYHLAATGEVSRNEA